MFLDTYRGKRVLITGHTGFKGSWLATWLLELGAEVSGYSLGPVSEPSHFALLSLAERMSHHAGDIRDREQLERVFDAVQPEYVFHLAAQSLVRRAYENPAETFETNTMGMVNLLECVRSSTSVKTAVLITSDKAYRNDNVWWGYRETDPLGGHDPYSGSKGCAELVAHSYFRSFIARSPVTMATTRAGNVIGGGDWADDRVVPDCIRAWSSAKPVVIRNPAATRPWQHVLEPLSGYLWLGAQLARQRESLNGEAFNFGPSSDADHSVADLLDAMTSRWPGTSWNTVPDESVHEATLLKLSCDKARHFLDWRPALQFSETVAMTVDWYRAWREKPADVFATTRSQIAEYSRIARARQIPWSAQ